MNRSRALALTFGGIRPLKVRFGFDTFRTTFFMEVGKHDLADKNIDCVEITN